MSDVEAFLSLCDEKRREHVVWTARSRLKAALRQRLARPESLELRNGDLFLYWRSAISSAQSGYKGPAVCLGVYRSLVVGYQGGHVITAHISRCLLHERSTHNRDGASLDTPSLPARRDHSLEAPVTLAELDQIEATPAIRANELYSDPQESWTVAENEPMDAGPPTPNIGVSDCAADNLLHQGLDFSVSNSEILKDALSDDCHRATQDFEISGTVPSAAPLLEDDSTTIPENLPSCPTQEASCRTISTRSRRHCLTLLLEPVRTKIWYPKLPSRLMKVPGIGSPSTQFPMPRCGTNRWQFPCVCPLLEVFRTENLWRSAKLRRMPFLRRECILHPARLMLERIQHRLMTQVSFLASGMNMLRDSRRNLIQKRTPSNQACSTHQRKPDKLLIYPQRH
jgi:hypothetical protein